MAATTASIRVIGSGEHEAERPSVGAAHHPDPRVAGRVEEHVGALGHEVHQRLRVRDLELGGVEVDATARRAVAASGPRDDDVAALLQLGRLRRHGVLRAAEAVREKDHGVSCSPCWDPHRRVQGHRRAVRLGAHRH